MATQPPVKASQRASGHLSRSSSAGGIVKGSKYGSARAEAGAPICAKRPDIAVLSKQISFWDWWNRELKDGGFLQRYLEREKALSFKRLRAVARRTWKRECNKKSDFRLRCVLPAREFFRLRAMDRHFFEDDTNIKNLVRDNPEVHAWHD